MEKLLPMYQFVITQMLKYQLQLKILKQLTIMRLNIYQNTVMIFIINQVASIMIFAYLFILIKVILV